jgi:hypothetical protein
MMANLLEKQIERSVCDYAKSHGMMALKFTSPSHAGVCDRLFISSHGKVWFGEFKQSGKKATALQSRHHQELAKRGVAVYLIDSIEQGREIVDHESQSSWQGHHRSAVRYIDCAAND